MSRHPTNHHDTAWAQVVEQFKREHGRAPTPEEAYRAGWQDCWAWNEYVAGLE